MAIVNIGILAHADAGKTRLTERIHFETGVVKAVCRIDTGPTQTDTEDTFGATSGALLQARATMHNAFRAGASYRIVGEAPTVEVRAIEPQLPALTRGEGSWVSNFAGIFRSAASPRRARGSARRSTARSTSPVSRDHKAVVHGVGTSLIDPGG